MSKRPWVLPLLAVLVLVGTAVLGGNDGEGIGERIAGVWIGTFSIPDSGAEPIAFITTYAADGTAQTTSANPRTGVHHVQWEKSGRREVTWRILHFNHDAEGKLVGISRTWGVQEFDKQFEEFAGEFTVEVCGHPDHLPFDEALTRLLDDPNDPDACFKPLASPGAARAKRLHVRTP
jgi:hypothetical protein